MSPDWVTLIINQFLCLKLCTWVNEDFNFLQACFLGTTERFAVEKDMIITATTITEAAQRLAPGR